MAKKETASAQTDVLAEQTALVAPPTANTNDMLAEYGEGVAFEDDGLGGLEPGDVRIAAKVFNMKGTDNAGDPLPPNVYYDTVEETAKKEINAVFLLRHRTHLYSVYDNEQGKTRNVCRSSDRVTGTMEDGTPRACKSCPDMEWTSDAKGKRHKNCGEVWNMFGMDTDTQQPFVVRFKRTSLPVIQGHLQKHHIMRRVVNGQRLNYPLFVFRAKLTLKMSDDKKYALPEITRGELLPAEMVREMASLSEMLKQQQETLLSRVDAQADRAESSGTADTSFNANDFSGGAGQDFVDAPASSTAA